MTEVVTDPGQMEMTMCWIPVTGPRSSLPPFGLEVVVIYGPHGSPHATIARRLGSEGQPWVMGAHNWRLHDVHFWLPLSPPTGRDAGPNTKYGVIRSGEATERS